MERIVPATELVRPQRRTDYFSKKSPLQFVNTGCTLLNCGLSYRGDGGWVLGRVANIVGDKSVGKTLLAIETCANFAIQYPKGLIAYREAEAAFDLPYAKELGMPIARIDFGPEGIDSLWDECERIGEDLNRFCDKCIKLGQPGLYVIDSWDAVSSKAERDRKNGQGSYNLEKQAFLSALFRKGMSRKLKQARVCLLIISQVRANIGAMFGPKYTRAGGKALDFYASHVVLLSQIKVITEVRSGIKRATAVQVRFKVTKNKISVPFREEEFILRFGFGVDDLEANLDWLEKVNRVDRLGITPPANDNKESRAKKLKKLVDDYFAESERLPDKEYRARVKEVGNVVSEVWQEVEAGFKSARKKYG